MSTPAPLNLLTAAGPLPMFLPEMPTEKPRRQVTIDTADMHRLEKLRVELQAPGRRGTPRALPLGVTFGQFLVQLALERAAQIEQEIRPPRRRR